MTKYDMIIIGSGAGLMVMREAVSRGLSCAVIENSKLGGTCLNRGCIPSKMLVYPADLIREIESCQRVGIIAGQPKLDWTTVARRMWEQIDYNKTIEKDLLAIPNLTLYKGTGRFLSPGSLEVLYDDGRPADIIYGDKFIIGAGARSQIPSFPGLDEAGYITSETFFGEKFPVKPWDSLVIIGGGAISMEFAHIFSAFGTKVTLIIRSGRILNKEEEEVAQLVARQMTKNGVEILTNTDIISVNKQGDVKEITAENRLTKERRTVISQEILLASGVQSNADTMALEKAGVEADKKGWVITNEYLETSQKNIWALGDINGKYQFRHKANAEAKILSHNLFNPEDKIKANYNSVPWTIFTHPQVAHLGMTEKELQDQDIPYKTAKNYYSEVVGGAAMGFEEGDDDDGFVKMIIGENKKILGVHIVGPQAAVLLQPFVYLMNTGNGCDSYCPQTGTYAPIDDSMIIHPSLNELTAWVFKKLRV